MPAVRIATVAGLASVLVALGALIAASSASAAFPGANGKIAFSQNGQIKVVNPDGSGEMALRPGIAPHWSADGREIAFHRGGVDTGSIWRMPADGGSETLVATGLDPKDPAWSPDSLRIALSATSCTDVCDEDVVAVKADRSCCPLAIGYAGIDAPSGVPSWSPNGASVAFFAVQDVTGIYAASPGVGGSPTPLYTDPAGILIENIDWSPDGTRIVFSMREWAPGTTYDVFVMPSAGGPLTQLTSNAVDDMGPAWSPDGSQIVFSSNVDGDFELYRMDPGGSNVTRITNNTVSDMAPSWQPIPLSYVRPKGAGPLRTALVPAYQECTAPDRVHGPPLEHPSCSSPAQTSSVLTVGTPDAGGGSAEFVGHVRFTVQPGDPGTPADEADVGLVFNATDVRCTLSFGPCAVANAEGANDYGGQVRGELSLRITDRNNNPTPSGPGPGTVTDTPLSFRATCTSTPADVGSTCSLSTTLDAVVPNIAHERQRAVWQMGSVAIWDAGPDGNLNTPANDRVFLRQGIFIP